MQKRLVSRYAMRSAEAADENQRRVEAVFDELSASKPTQVIVTKSEDRPRRTGATPLFQDAPKLFGGDQPQAH